MGERGERRERERGMDKTTKARGVQAAEMKGRKLGAGWLWAGSAERVGWVGCVARSHLGEEDEWECVGGGGESGRMLVIVDGDGIDGRVVREEAALWVDGIVHGKGLADGEGGACGLQRLEVDASES